MALGHDLLGQQGEERVDDMLFEVRHEQRLGVDARLVLGRHEHRLELGGPAVLVTDAHLGLAVGPQVREHVRPAHFGEPARQHVREPDRHRHQVRRLVAGEAEHHPLVARPLQRERVGFAVADLGRA